MLYSCCSNNNCVSTKAALQMSHGRQINAAMKLGQPRTARQQMVEVNGHRRMQGAWAKDMCLQGFEICYVAVTDWPGPVPSEPKSDCRQAGLQLQPAIRIRASLLPCSKIRQKMCFLDQCT